MAFTPSPCDSLQTSFFNANGLLAARDELQVFAEQHNLDVVMVNETRLSPSQKDPKIAGFTLYRRDRPVGRGGGVAIYVKNSIPHHAAPIPQLNHLEAIGVVIRTSRGPLSLYSCYVPPRTPPAPFEIELLDILRAAPSVIAAGDFNAKHIDWHCRNSNARGRLLRSLTERHAFNVLAPPEPTHFHYVTGLADTLDIAIVRNVTYHVDLTSLQDLSSDHNPVLMQIGDRGVRQPPLTNPRVNWDMFKSHLAESFGEVAPIETVEDLERSVADFEGKILASLDEATTRIPVPPSGRRIPREILDLIGEKKAARSRATRTRVPADRTRYNFLTRKVRQALQDFRNVSFQERLQSLCTEDNSVWRMSKIIRNKRKPLPPIHGTRGLVFSDEEKAEAFADTLELQCRPTWRNVDVDRVENVEDRVASFLSSPLADQISPSTPSEVSEILRHLKPKKAPGPDNVSNKALQNLPDIAVSGLTAIINTMLRLNHFPSRWKCANVIFIHKPGKDPKFPQNHRPISLLPCLGKVAERVIRVRLAEICSDLDILPEEQFGFRPHHSTTDQLLRFVELSSRWLNWKHSVGATFFDVSKAFDTVWHDGLIDELIRRKVPGSMIHLLHSFLSGRTFRTKINSALSSERQLEAGVPQGAVLSPILFAIYISDMPKPENCSTAVYADDTAVICHSLDPDLLVRYLQSAVDQLLTYFGKKRIEVNAEKTRSLCISRRRRQPSGNVTIENRPIPWSAEVKYLGVKLDKRLNFSAHLEYAISKAKTAISELYPLTCRKSKLSTSNKLLLYKSIIRPSMMYACPAWGHLSKSQLNRLQIVQNRCLRTAFDSPWYVRNAQLHREAELPTIADLIREINSKAFAKAKEHPNSLMRDAIDYVSDPRDKVRRPRTTVTLPD